MPITDPIVSKLLAGKQIVKVSKTTDDPDYAKTEVTKYECKDGTILKFADTTDLYTDYLVRSEQGGVVSEVLYHDIGKDGILDTMKSKETYEFVIDGSNGVVQTDTEEIMDYNLSDNIVDDKTNITKIKFLDGSFETKYLYEQFKDGKTTKDYIFRKTEANGAEGTGYSEYYENNKLISGDRVEQTYLDKEKYGTAFTKQITYIDTNGDRKTDEINCCVFPPFRKAPICNRFKVTEDVVKQIGLQNAIDMEIAGLFFNCFK